MNEFEAVNNMSILNLSKMKKLIASCVIAITPILSYAGLVEVASSQFIRDSGSPKTESSQVELKNPGEIRVSNAGLESSQIEIASSTEITLNGQNLLKPFSLPPGGSVVFDLAAGTYDVAVTLRGKPGGAVKVRFFENRPDAPTQGRGYQLLSDGTVLAKKTGLIWHVYPATPGESAEGRLRSLSNPVFDANDYINKLNSGAYGEDSISGNAGYTDWRMPTIEELSSHIDFGTVSPGIADQDGYYSSKFGGGMQYGKPFFLCSRWLTLPCADREAMYLFLSSTTPPWYENKRYGIDFDEIIIVPYNDYGLIWPVRGKALE